MKKYKLTKYQHKNWKTWIEALRSDKYKQCVAKLHSPALNAYCCLGVACEVVPPTLKQFNDNDWKNQGMWTYEYGRKKFGVSFRKIKIANGDPIYWNDGLNLNFHKIADRLETWYKENCE